MTNGMTIADFIAVSLGLPLVPPSSNYALVDSSTTGINYAYAGAGILPETNPTDTWNFDKQISNFSSSLRNNQNRAFRQPDELAIHLRESIFLISFGTNDYIKNFFVPSISKSPEEFAEYLLNAFSARLTTLYMMGARKFIVINIWPMGCMPWYHFANMGICNDTMNYELFPYTYSMPYMLQDLASNLPGFDFYYSDNFSFVRELNLNTGKSGITNTTGFCMNDYVKTLCEDRDKFLHFDFIHTSQAANSLFMQKCFDGTICSPKNKIQLVKSSTLN